MNKASGEKNLYRGLGSIDIAAIARSVLMIARDKDNPSIRYMFPVKSSLAPEGSAVAFSMNDLLGFCWLGRRNIDTNDITLFADEESKKTLATRIIRDVLAIRDDMSSHILRKLKLMDVSERTINKVKKELGIESYRRDGSWYWHLPDGANNKAREENNG
jgi:hypothetical protein